MRSRDRVLRSVALLLRLLLVLNLALFAAFAIGLLLSWPFAPTLAAHLVHKYGSTLAVGQAVTVVRLMLVIGTAAALALHPLLASLLRIVATVEIGDPFVDANATRLMRIGWALLVLQLLDLCLGALGRWIVALRLDWTGWTPSLGGWLAVAMVFVLARVFRIGARMRDDLAATV